jgi:protein-tyrosine-phosphatase
MPQVSASKSAKLSPVSLSRAVARLLVATGRRFGASVYHFPERILHRGRRARARRVLAAAEPVRRVLFICYGNVCRSPFAAMFFARASRQVLGEAIDVSSAGFIGPDRQPPVRALAAASRRGLDMSTHRSALVTPAALRQADLVVVMEAGQATALQRQVGRPRGKVVVLGDLDPHPIVRRSIRDPWGGDDVVFEHSYARIERCLTELVEVMRGDTRRSS